MIYAVSTRQVCHGVAMVLPWLQDAVSTRQVCSWSRSRDLPPSLVSGLTGKRLESCLGFAPAVFGLRRTGVREEMEGCWGGRWLGRRWRGAGEDEG